MLGTRGAHKVHRESFMNASSSNYIDEMYEQWSKDPQSVHKVHLKISEKDKNQTQTCIFF
jgi:2-oxoglutarate dehydrogenase complex dehydrogenase (E1) component-like enzyme